MSEISKEEKIKRYQERQNRKLERYTDLATKNKEESKAVYEYGQRIADAIPMGQPILVGHHSEKRHRRDLERINNSMTKSIELKDKAVYYENKANNIVNPNSISSDNPEAIQQLKTKLNRLEKQREAIKAYNNSYRKGKADIELLDDNLKKELQSIKRVWKDDYFPAYVLSNLSANIRTVKQRIERLSKIEKIEDIEETVNGITLTVDKIENRVKLSFPCKPERDIINKLKQNGFHWSPYNKAWQRMISEYSIELARQIIEDYKA